MLSSTTFTWFMLEYFVSSIGKKFIVHISKSFSKFTQFYAIKSKMAFSKVILFGSVKKEVSISVFKSFRIIVYNIIIKSLLNCKKGDKREAKVSYYSLR